jgi:hypothetical protein
VRHTTRNLAYGKIRHEEGWTKAPTAIHGTLGLKFHPLDKVNEIADCLENLSTHHGLCDENH